MSTSPVDEVLDVDALHRGGRLAVIGGVLVATGAGIPFDWVFGSAALGTTLLAWSVWQLGRVAHDTRDPLRQAGTSFAILGLAISTLGFLGALVGAVMDRPDLVLLALVTTVSAGLYILLPAGMLMLGVRAIRWEQLPAWGAWIPVIMGLMGIISLPATILLGLPGPPPGGVTTFLALLRDVALIGWIPLGVAMRRAVPPPLP